MRQRPRLRGETEEPGVLRAVGQVLLFAGSLSPIVA